MVALACALAFASCGGSASLNSEDKDKNTSSGTVDGDGNGGGDNKTANATAWVLSDSPFDTNRDVVSYNEVRAVAYGAGKFVVGGTGGSLAYSEDGLSWTKVTQWKTTNLGTYDVESLTYTNGIFVLGSYGKMAYSTDGVEWQMVGVSGDLGGVDILGIAYADGRYVAAAAQVGVASATSRTTPPAFGWDEAKANIFQERVGLAAHGIAYGVGKFVAVGDGGRIAYSATGKGGYSNDWTKPTTNGFGTYSIQSIVYGKDKFVAAGYKGQIGYSEDGTRWVLVDTPVFGNDHNKIYGVTYGGGKYVAVGEQGKIAVSSDAANAESWKIVGSGVFLENDIYDVAYGNGKFVAVGDRAKIAVSTN